MDEIRRDDFWAITGRILTRDGYAAKLRVQMRGGVGGRNFCDNADNLFFWGAFCQSSRIISKKFIYEFNLKLESDGV